MFKSSKTVYELVEADLLELLSEKLGVEPAKVSITYKMKYVGDCAAVVGLTVTVTN